MTGQFYDNPQRTILHMNVAVTTTAAALLEGIVGPAGKIGRVTRLDAAVTTVYVGTDTVTLDNVAGTLAVPAAIVITGADNLVISTPKSVLDTYTDLPADTPLVFTTDGLSTSGVASITLEISWY